MLPPRLFTPLHSPLRIIGMAHEQNSETHCCCHSKNWFERVNTYIGRRPYSEQLKIEYGYRGRTLLGASVTIGALGVLPLLPLLVKHGPVCAAFSSNSCNQRCCGRMLAHSSIKIVSKSDKLEGFC